jgi:protein-S-isoprenylcysteine O-methyltransferase Ste14
MKLKEKMAQTGELLFRRRSWLPLSFVPVLLLALADPTFHATMHWDHEWEMLCLAIAGFGIGVRVLVAGYSAAGTSGRNTREQKAERLNTTGAYSVVRHPLYLGNAFIWMGCALFPRSISVAVIGALAFWLYYERIMLAEEAFLEARFGEAFASWAARTPAFLPAIRRWVPPELSFSLKAVLARENTTVLATTWTFFALEVAGDCLHKPFAIDPGWAALAAATAGGYAVLRWLKKSGRLHVPGR